MSVKRSITSRDCRLPPSLDPPAFADLLDHLAGMLGHGLFLREVQAAYIAGHGVVHRLDRPTNRAGVADA